MCKAAAWATCLVQRTCQPTRWLTFNDCLLLLGSNTQPVKHYTRRLGCVQRVLTVRTYPQRSRDAIQDERLKARARLFQ